LWSCCFINRWVCICGHAVSCHSVANEAIYNVELVLTQNCVGTHNFVTLMTHVIVYVALVLCAVL
jgi:hypothetical protein